MVQLILGQAAFNKSPRIDAGRNVALIVNQIPAILIIRSAKEMVETHLIEHSRRLVGGHVPA